MCEKKYFIRLTVGYRDVYLDFATIAEATAFADAYFEAVRVDKNAQDEGKISIEFGKWIPQISEEKDEPVENEKED